MNALLRRDEVSLSRPANEGQLVHLDAMSIAKEINRLLTEGGKTAKQVATIFQRSLGWVSLHKRLISLHPSLQQRVIDDAKKRVGKTKPRTGKRPLVYSIAQLLSGFPDEKQLVLAEEISDRSRFATDEAVREYIANQLASTRTTGSTDIMSHPSRSADSAATKAPKVRRTSPRISKPAGEPLALKELQKFVELIDGIDEYLHVAVVTIKSEDGPHRHTFEEMLDQASPEQRKFLLTYFAKVARKFWDVNAAYANRFA